MQIISLVENTRLAHRQDLHTEPDLATYIFSNGRQILFDTGMSGIFHSNARRLNVDITQTDLAVISHHHFDHGGGLATLLETNRQAMIYLRSSTADRLSLELIGLFKRSIGLDQSLFQRYPKRFAFVN